MTLEPDLEDFERIRQLGDLLTPNAIRVAVTLGIPEMIDSGIDAVEDIIAKTGAHPDALRSVIAVLRERGVLSSEEPGRVVLTRLGRTLLDPRALVGFDLGGAPAHIDAAFAGLETTVRTGEASYESVHGMPFWDHLAANPELSASFDRYLSMHATGWVADVAALEVWANARHLVDVGGGDGYAVAEILRVHPHLKGTLVDLEAPAGRAAARFAEAGLAERATATAGSFFDPLPEDGDVYLLAHILHDWPDDESIAIMRRVAEVSPERLFVVDQVISEERSTFAQAWSDLRMRALFASGERTEEQWREIATAAGFELVAIHPWGFAGSILELTPTGFSS